MHCSKCRNYHIATYPPIIPVGEVEFAQTLSGSKLDCVLCPACWMSHHSQFDAGDLADVMWDVIHKQRGEQEQAELLVQAQDDRIKALRYDLQEQAGTIDRLCAEINDMVHKP